MAQSVFGGVKIADFSWAGVGPMMAKTLGDFGATVVHVETNRRVDVVRTMAPYKDGKPGLNRGGFFAMYNNNKYGVTLNLDHSKGVEIAKKFILWCDIFIESFRPGVVDKWGLSYNKIREINPSIIMMSTCMQGQTGPRANHPGYGAQLVSLTGFTRLTGWPDRIPTQPFSAYTDIIAPKFGIGALVSALIYVNKTGKGRYFDLSQYEAGLQFLSPAILDYRVNGRIADRMGNHCDYATPHGAYPCKEEDSWCVISVFSDGEWQSLCQVMGDPRWAKDNKFTTLLGRKQNEEELDHLIGGWTMNLTANDVMTRLQDVGVPAGVVKNAREIHSDPQLNHRGYFKELEHLEIGKHLYHEESYKLSKSPSNLSMAAPCQGQHNEYVYTGILGMSDEDFVELDAAGVFE